ncbi:MAG: 30S ribosome-binding factor RbfA [Desulfoprunum sp.]|nr:30S ribosome-binding factor RbfA [Desulfoprunum sp.]
MRVSDVIRKELAILLLTKVRDQKLATVNITRVEVADDLKYARVFFTVLGDHKAIKAAEAAFDRAKGFMRSHLAKTLNMRYTPSLQFRFDEIAEKVEHIENIFQEIANEGKTGEENS